MATVLVVDDREVNRDLVRTLLTARGHVTVEADDGLCALDLIGARDFDLVITDVLMPSMDGYELVREMRAGSRGNAVPVIFYTANYLEEEARPIAAALGVTHVVTKTGDILALLAAIDSALTQPLLPISAPVDDDFSREHLRVLNAKLVEKIRELEDQERLHRLVEAAVSVSGDLSLPDTLARIVSSARALVNARYAGLRRLGESGESMILAEDGLCTSLGSASAIEVPVLVRGTHYCWLTVVGAEESGELARSTRALLVELAGAAGPAVANAQTYDEAQRRQAWLSASADVMTALLSADPDEALELVVQSARQVAGTYAAWITVPTASGMADVRHADTNGADPTAEPLVTIPLNGSPEAGATLVLANRPTDPPLNPVDVEMATTFARHASLALAFAKADADRRRLSVLEERDRIATDLHDVVIQRLFALGMRLASMRSTLPPLQADRIESVVSEIDETIDDVRSSIFSLRADADSGDSLRHDLLRIVDRSADGFGFRPRLRIVGPVEAVVPAETRVDLLATLRESLSNVGRHAKATAVVIELIAVDGVLSLRVTDNGCGLPTDRHESGLANLRRRAEHQGGAMTLTQPRTGAGLVLSWTIPLARPSVEPTQIPALQG